MRLRGHAAIGVVVPAKAGTSSAHVTFNDSCGSRVRGNDNEPMTPQASFMVLAPVDPQRATELRRLLASMNDAPGRANPRNALVPFGEFDTLHFARFMVIDDKTVGDIRVYGVPPRSYPLYLAFLGDVDGDADAFLADVAKGAPQGLRAIFSCCEGFRADDDLYGWMKNRFVRPAANYVNWRGRTVQRVREEAALYDALERHIREQGAALEGMPAREVHAALRKHVAAEQAAGRLPLTSESPTPLGWWSANLLHLIGAPLLLVLLSPVVLVVALVGIVRIRMLEKTDPVICPRTDAQQAAALALIEDHDIANQFSALGSVKPGVVRRWTVASVLRIIDYFARHVYTRGRLARVRTIHFARWVWLDNKERVIFCSNYDGSLESYMDDFINKAGFGLNAAFGSGVGYPRTNWLVLDGCADERNFKEFLRRHQLPTDVWYMAYPGLTAVDLERNGRIRRGLESTLLSDAEARAWIGLL